MASYYRRKDRAGWTVAWSEAGRLCTAGGLTETEARILCEFKAEQEKLGKSSQRHPRAWELARPTVSLKDTMALDSLLSLPAHLSRKIRVWGQCWIWTGGKHTEGYGIVACGGKKLRVHRMIYELIRGPIPTDRMPDHLCRKPACVNPFHIDLVDNTENSRRGANTKLRHRDIPLIHKLRTKGMSVRRIAERFSVAVSAIRGVLDGSTWSEFHPSRQLEARHAG